MQKYTWLALVLLVPVAACDRSRQELEATLAARDSLSAEKDSLIAEVLETSRFVTDINAELAKVKDLAPATTATGDRGVPGAEADRRERAAALERIQKLIVRLNEAEGRLANARARLRDLTQNQTQLIAQLDEYQKSLADLRATMEAREAELSSQIAALEGRVDTLSAVASALTDTVRTLVEEKHTVYFVAGTKEELLQKGVLVQEGSKFLFFGSRRLEPARDLNVGMFTALDMRRDTVIVLPDTAQAYRIVSRQNTEYADSASIRDGKVRGVLHIVTPEGFWGPSRYLILVKS